MSRRWTAAALAVLLHDSMLAPIISCLGPLRSLPTDFPVSRLPLCKPCPCHAVTSDLTKLTSTSHSHMWSTWRLSAALTGRSGPWTCISGHYLPSPFSALRPLPCKPRALCKP